MSDDYHDELSKTLNIENKLIVSDKKGNRGDDSPGLFTEHKNSVQKTSTSNESKKVVIRDDDDMVKDGNKDYIQARSMLYKMLETGTEALDGILEVAQASDHPRAYEVVAMTMKNVADITDKLMKLHVDVQDIENKKNESNKPSGKDPTPQGANTTNNNVFVGSTSELQDMIDRMTRKSVANDTE